MRRLAPPASTAAATARRSISTFPSGRSGCRFVEWLGDPAPYHPGRPILTTRLLFLRHAVTEHTGARLSGWAPGVHLSERGREQARALAERLAPLPVDAVYASPLERCLETAQPLAEARGLEVTTIEDLGEVRYGEWTGRELKELAKLDLWKVVQGLPSGVRFPDGESLYELQVRVVGACERLRAGHEGKAVVVCSHADAIKAALAHYIGLHLDLFQRLVVSPASLSVLAFTPVPRLLRLNDTGDLADLVPPAEEEAGEEKEASNAEP